MKTMFFIVIFALFLSLSPLTAQEKVQGQTENEKWYVCTVLVPSFFKSCPDFYDQDTATAKAQELNKHSTLHAFYVALPERIVNRGKEKFSKELVLI